MTDVLATPPPVPRQFTDEELKQQYGIHMATRLQADEAGKESKWADIDDDEDDWAPETVEWMDGTKSSVLPADAQPTPPPGDDGRAVALKQDGSEDLSRPSSTPAQKSNAPVSNKTILKPGVHLSKANVPTTDGSEKSSPASKPTTSQPTKNPWAPLPPIDKVAPVFPQPPPQAPSLSPFRRDPHGFESLPPAPAGPAREIAADDFNRTWMDDRGPRELFDSKSGRYEPVGEMRRGSTRHDHGSRYPALLQRPPHSDRAAPAEPSPAFQTRSTGADGGNWARRRTSSIVSAGSGGRRFSLGRPPDERPDNLSPIRGAAVESPQQQFATVDMGVSPASAGQRSWPPNSPTFNTAQLPPGAQTPHLANGDGLPGPPAGPPDEDPVERQARLMSEKKEATRLRKQREREEEAREEAARKERLRLKMEALGPATPSPDLKEPKGKEAAVVEQQAKSPRQPKAMTISPPKPPIPTGDGEVAQYGVMKVHQPHPVRKGPSAGVITEGSSASKSMPEASDQSGQAISATSVTYGEHSTFGQAPANAHSVAGRRVQDSHAPLESMTWKTPSPHTTYNWGNNTNSNSNVWGPPQNKNRGLGNGTFNNDYNRITNTIAHGRTTESPGPIAPPHSMNAFSRPALFDQQLLPSSDSSQMPEHLIPSNLDNFDPPATKMIFEQPGNQKAEPRRFTPDEWQRAANGGIQAKEAKEAEEERIKAAFSAAAGLPTNRGPTGLVSQFKEQWIQTGIVGSYGARKVLDKTTTEYNKPDSKKTENDVPVLLPSTTVNESQSGNERLAATTMTTTQSQASHASAATSTRPSRFVGFFPRHENNQSSANSDSPPPDVSSLFYDDGQQPRVNLPTPKPVVKLPPAASAEKRPAQTPTVTALRVNANSITGKGAEIQHRVVALLEEMRVKPHSPAIASASKAPLDVAAQQGGTKVALPNSTAVNVVDKASAHAATDDVSTEANSKPMAEELLEDREFASRPTVHLPKAQHENASLPIVPNVLLNGRAASGRSQRPVDIYSIFNVELFSDEESGGLVSIYVKLPGQSERRMFTARAQPKPRISGRFNSNNSNNNKGRRNFGERRDSNNTNANNVNSNGRKPSNSYRGGRNGNARSGKPGAHGSAVVAH